MDEEEIRQVIDALEVCEPKSLRQLANELKFDSRKVKNLLLRILANKKYRDVIGSKTIGKYLLFWLKPPEGIAKAVEYAQAAKKRLEELDTDSSAIQQILVQVSSIIETLSLSGLTER